MNYCWLDLSRDFSRTTDDSNTIEESTEDETSGLSKADQTSKMKVFFLFRVFLTSLLYFTLTQIRIFFEIW